ncbi:MAG: SDR family oxidoreductase [Acidimicrobiales bacterium]
MASKVVLITGASAGFGKASAEHLARIGHRVYGTSRRAKFPHESNSTSFPVMLPMDVCDDDSVRRAVDFVLAEEGNLDVVVNNAGVGLAGSVEDTSIEEVKDLFEANFFGALRVCQAVLPTLRAQGSGLIVNVSSLAGLVTIPFQGFYSASKFALESMSDALRMEVRPFGVNVTLIEPGDFRTNFTSRRIFTDGSDAYRQRCHQAVSVMEHDEQNGNDPAQLAELLASIIERSSPKPRYTVGSRSQRMTVALRGFIPSGFMDKAVCKTYKI